MDNNKINDHVSYNESDEQEQFISEPVNLDDEQRVKVLSPSQLVFKRFIRNKLAITGLAILVVMFTFSFLGGLITPYGESQVFKITDSASLTYANAVYNDELRYTAVEGGSFEGSARAAFILAVNKNQTTFSDGEMSYTYNKLSDDFYTIDGLVTQITVDKIAGGYNFNAVDGSEVQSAIKNAFEDTIAAGETVFTLGGTDYTITSDKRSYSISTNQKVAIATMLVFDAYNEADESIINSYDFKYLAESALLEGKNEFSLADENYKIVVDGKNTIIQKSDGSDYAAVSNIIVNTSASGVFLTVEMKNAFREAINAKQETVEYDGVSYIIDDVNSQLYIKTETQTELIDMYASPSFTHLLGTDSNGMDVLTRLMFGGRVSLMVGFVVVFIELLIGVILGGISGYFGGWIDTGIMRFVDLFNCIPNMPMLIILGAVLDANKIQPQIRIYLLMMILGLLGWTGIARIVRGQILSLREQDFMIATEATGIRISRRISRHLVPNVMPLLIVQATMSLGGIIITEATLSFLGLGVKFPLASWGTIINAATNIAVMTHYWFIWIPAGILILFTVLGFNFMGDGLRDAFDPKMKR